MQRLGVLLLFYGGVCVNVAVWQQTEQCDPEDTRVRECDERGPSHGTNLGKQLSFSICFLLCCRNAITASLLITPSLPVCRAADPPPSRVFSSVLYNDRSQLQ